MSGRRPLVTARSNAAGAPLLQRGMYTSAGRRRSSVFEVPFSGVGPRYGRGWKRPGLSSSGASPAAKQVWKTWFLNKLWGLVRSPPHAQTRQWSPYMSTVSSHRKSSGKFRGRWVPVAIVEPLSGSVRHLRVFVMPWTARCVATALPRWWS